MQVLKYDQLRKTRCLTCRDIIFILILVVYRYVQCSEMNFISLNMPDVRPTHDESYLCVAKRLNPIKTQYIVGFQPNASASKVHHILIYGCSIPGKYLRDTPDYAWECGEMNQIDDPSIHENSSTYEQGPVCALGANSKILFSWALNAPAVEMPPGVGFKVGGSDSSNGIDYLVLQVHYGHTQIFRRDPALRDNSGIILETVFSGIDKLAGIYLLWSFGVVGEGKSKHVMECEYQEPQVLHPIRFRTHTHKLGVKVAGYLSHQDNPFGYQLIGEQHPQKPQMFYPVNNESLQIQRGDKIGAYCEFENNRGHPVQIGPTGNDEMCNFYIMYWTESLRLPQSSDCSAYNMAI